MPGAGLLEFEPGTVGMEVEVLPVVQVQGQDVVAGGHVLVGRTLRADRDPESRAARGQHAPQHGIENLSPPGTGEQDHGRKGQGGKSLSDDSETGGHKTHKGESRKLGPVRYHLAKKVAGMLQKHDFLSLPFERCRKSQNTNPKDFGDGPGFSPRSSPRLCSRWGWR